ncbi:hypothetical protein PMF13cell1_05585 [Blautia producta]|uniref:Prophage tail endopeptidase domain-containing protein n=1 Tax=Blautia producta TaxID=33035 RepID=A0A4P6M5D0_9FIRM|nr:hypothetical protein [Blautia producta]QBE99989.1 hypothetical protein PMF13cell1_05585 [Blautia producta]
MINTSPEYKQALNEKRRFVARASCLLKNGTVLDFDKTNLMAGGIKIADGVSGTSKFEVGTAIINQLTIMVFNGADAFSDYDFTDAVLTVWVGMPLDDRIEWLKKGVFNATDPTTTPGVITLKALDNMSKFDQAYDGGIGFPSTLQSIVQYCCTQCGVLLVNGEFPNFRYQINKNPFTDTTNITYRAIIAYCALLAGCYARCNVDGRLEFKWFDTAAFDGIIDGGVFDETTESSYQTGANLDGGNFTDYSSGDTADGGTFTDALLYHHIYSFSSLSVSTEDVVITGIRVTAADSEDTAGKKIEGETYLCGAEGYVLDVSGNPLIEAGKAKDVAEYLAGRVVGMRFRPFQASAIGDPSWEAGDAAVVTDRKGNSYYTYLTNITYSTGGYASISCDAEPAARHSADRYAEINKIVSDIKKDSQQKLSEYADYVNQLNSLAINAMGYYETSEMQSDGSTINYMHDKPLLSDSTIVYKKTIDGFFISRDGGKTYVGGMDKDANIVANVIAAIGISFDWASGGTLTLGKKDGKSVGIMEILRSTTTSTGDIMNAVIGRWDEDGIIIKDGSINLVGTENVGGKIYTYAFSVANGKMITSYPFIKGRIDMASATAEKGRPIMKMNTDTQLYMGSSDTNEKLSSIYVQADGVTVKALSSSNPTVYIQEKLNTGDIRCSSLSGVAADFSGKVKAYQLEVWGEKSRIAETKNYGNRLLYCYETPTPYFGDIGTGRTDEGGICYVSIDDIFHETVNIGAGYSVFLQKEGAGDIWVEEKTSAFFVVKGTSNLPFSWEIKVVQKDYEYLRLEDCELQDEMDPDNYDKELQDIFEHELEVHDKEMEELINENFKVVSGD